MKRIAWVVFFFFLSSHAAMAAPEFFSFTNNDAGSTITLNQDTVAVLELWSNPSTGHGWRVKFPLGKHIRIVGSEFESSQPGLLGTGGTEKIYVVGADRGRSELVLEYRRAHGQAVIDTVRYNFITQETFTDSFSLPSLDESPTAADLQTEVESAVGLPTSFNWCDQNGCTPVKDQGNCGSCWAFATVCPLESMIKINDGETVDLSEQYLVSCNDDGWGCNGGFWAFDYHEWKKNSSQAEAGAVLESEFPYRASDVGCGGDHSKSHQITSWNYVCGNSSCTPSTDQLKQAIYDHGPLSVAVCANSAMSNYRGGVFAGPGCKELNHAVVLVGWNDNGNYWIMRNSWGSSWGESGYMRIGYGVSGIGAEASYVEYGGAPDPDPDPDPDPELDDGEIENGETIFDLSAESGDWFHFYIDVPEGATDLNIVITGGSGDADLYTRFNAEPTTSAYDCRPYRNGNSETCSEAGPQAGRWHVGLRGYRAFSGVSLTASYETNDQEPESELDSTGQCVAANNREHIAQGRAYRCRYHHMQACAVGSGDNLGWATQFRSETSSVQQTADNYWEKVESCQ